MTGCHTVLERINVSNENWNDPAKTPSQPQPPNGQPSAPAPQAPPATPAPEGAGAGSYSSPNYSTPSYTPPVYGTPDAGQAASPASGTPSYGAPAGGGYTAPDPTPAYGTPASGGYTAPDPTPAYGAAPTYGTDPSAPAYGSPPAYGSTPSAGSYGSAPEPASGSGYTDPAQGGYGQSQPGQYGAAGYGQPAEGYQDPNAAYGTTPAPTYGAGYPNTGVSAYGYDAGYASPTPELASFGNRALGWLIDYAAPMIVFYILNIIISVVLYRAGGLAGLLNFVLWLALVAFLVWNSGYQAGVTGYSLGRKIAKNKLVSEATGQPLGVGAGIGRVFAHMIDGAICGIGWLFPLWDSKRQTIADKIVKSVVVVDPNAGQAPQQ
jgi:uncharacterized RDD family membrane protein YckC